jgi:hypothetical protein
MNEVKNITMWKSEIHKSQLRKTEFLFTKAFMSYNKNAYFQCNVPFQIITLRDRHNSLSDSRRL